MKKNGLQVLKNKLIDRVYALKTLEELEKMDVILNFGFSATNEEKQLLDKMMKSDAFDPDQMISFMKETLVGNKQSRLEVVAI